MSAEVMKEDDTQFRCMLCDYTATSKPEIGNHFLTDHMDAYVSPVKEENMKDDAAAKEVESVEHPDTSDMVAKGVNIEGAGDNEESEVPKDVPRQRGRPPKKQTQRPIKKQPYYYIEEVDEPGETEETEPQQFGRGMRRRKRAIPRHILRYEIDDDEIDDEEFAEKEKKRALPKKKFPPIMPQARKDKSGGRGRKRGRPRLDDGGLGDDGPSRVPRGMKRVSVSKLPLSERVVDMILNDRAEQWYKQFQDKNVTQIPCPFDPCTLTITNAELEVHLQCHAANLVGFRCPISGCDFLCPHWSNMRVHYRKEHNTLFHKLVCNERGCSMVFPRIDRKSILIHVTRKHLRPTLHEELSRPDFAETAYEKYITSAAREEASAADASKNVKMEGMGGDDPSATEQEPREKSYPAGIVASKEMMGDMDEDAPVAKKRGRPRGSTKAAKLARIAAGEIVEKPGKKDKKGKGKRAFTRALNHVAFFCDVCGGKYKSEEVILQHKAQHYRGDNLNVVHCTECQDFSSDEPDDIRDHVATFHKSLLHLHRCDNCSFSTNRYHDLKKHLLVHSGSKDYMCDKCGTCTTTAYNLRVHWRRYHAGEEEKRISCFACDYRCADNGILKEHIRSKHGLMVYGKDYNNARPLPTYSCPHCNYVGRKKSSLSYHMRIHTENRQFKCHICPYASKTKNNLLLHIRTHEGLQPLKCPECDFRGATNKIISEHVMCKHARIRPYTCKICGWTSSYHGNMWKHVENHRRDLGDAMPDDPVSVIASEDHMIAAPLKAPTLKKRGSTGSPGGSGRTPKMRGKRNRSRYEEMTNVQMAVDGQNMQDDSMKESVVIQLPVSSVLDSQTITLAEGISEEAAMGASALSRLAQGAEITVREVHFLHPSDNQQQQHHEMITYNVPPVAVTQQIIAGGDMGHVINEQHYQPQPPQHHHHDHQQQHHQQHDQDRDVEHHYGEGSIQTVQVVTSQENGVPRAVTEQVVHAMPQQQQQQQHHQDHHQDHHPDHRGGDGGRDQTVVHQLIPMTLPHEAELVMSMMQAHQASIAQSQ